MTTVGETPPTAQWAVGQVVEGRYEVKRVAGVGAMGQVLQVWHRQWEIDLAVKCPASFETAAQRERFVAEAEAWVSLGLHPNICGCHYVRVFDGVPRVFAEYVGGGSLHDWISDGRLAGRPELAMDVAIQIAWGLAHAHDRGLIHRDVKPANILFDSTVAKVTDFGLSRTSGMTRLYASPEQMSRKPLETTSDVFSFAVTVLEMFTGRVTWPLGPAAGAELEAHRHLIPAGLADLLERCLRIDPAARPASMTEIAAAIAEVHRDVTGRRYPRLRPKAADLRGDELNNRALSLLDLDRSAEAQATFEQALTADPQHARATYNAGLMRWRRGEITDEDVIADLDAVRIDTGDSEEARHALGLAHLERGDVESARSFVEPDPAVTDARCVGTKEIPWCWTRPGWGDPILKVDITADGRRAVTCGVDDHVRVWDVLTGECTHTLEGHSKGVRFVRITPNGLYAVSAGGDHTTRFWDLADGKCLRTIKTTGVPEYPGLSAWLAVCVERGNPGSQVIVWDLRGRQVRWRLDERVSAVELSPDGRWALAVGDEDPAARLWDLDTGECRTVLEGQGGSPSAVCFDISTGIAAIGSYRTPTVGIWDLATGENVGTLAGHARFVQSLALSADGKRLLSGALDGTVRLWDLEKFRCLRTFRGHESEVRHVQWGANDQYALSAGQDNTIRLWRTPSPYTVPAQLSRPREHEELTWLDDKVDVLVEQAERFEARGDLQAALASLREAREVPGHERSANVVAAWRAFSRSAVHSGLRAVWPVRGLPGHRSGVMAVDASSGVAVSGGLDGHVRVWDLQTGEGTHTFKPETTRFSGVDVVQFSEDDARVMASCRDGSVHAWSLWTGELLYSHEGDRLIATDTTSPVMSMIGPLSRGPRSTRFGADGTTALIGGADRAFRLWDLERGICLRTMEGHTQRVHSACLGSGTLAATTAFDHSVRLWDLATGDCLHVLHGHTAAVTAVALSERLVASAGGYEDHTIRLWDIVTGDSVAVLENPSGDANTVQFTSDGHYLVSGDDSTVRVWDIASGQCLRAVEAHRNGVESVALTKDGQFVVSGGADGRVRQWALDWDLEVR